MFDFSSTEGAAALVAGIVALAALLLAAYALRRLRSLRADQLAVIGEGEPRDLIRYVRELERGVEAIAARVDGLAADGAATAGRLEGAISHCGVVRYDAYQEMSGRQSSSVALLDEHRDGVVLSSILHREQARLYAKSVAGGRSEIGFSPEERAAIAAALGERSGDAG